MSDTSYVFTLYDTGIPDETVTRLLTENTTNEQALIGRTITSTEQVWDGPVAEAKDSPVVEHLPRFLVEQDYNERTMRNSRIKVLKVEAEDIEEPADA